MSETHSQGFLRGAGLKFAAGLLGLLLIVEAGAVVMRFVIVEPSAIKSAIARSGTYEHLIDASLSAAPKPASKTDTPDIPYTDPIIKDSMNQAFNPRVVQDHSENFIDSTFRWLNGSAAQPDFVLDFGSSNEAFIQGAGDRLTDRLRGLPACSISQLQSQKQSEIFNATCLPPGASVSQIVEQAKSTLRSKKDFLPESKITADSLKRPGETQNIFARSNNAPAQFQSFKNLPWILLAMCVLLALAIIALSTTYIEGLKKVGKITTISAILILLISLGLLLAPSTLISEQALAANQIARDITVPLITEFTRSAAKIYAISGGILLVSGVLLWVGSRRILTKKTP